MEKRVKSQPASLLLSLCEFEGQRTDVALAVFGANLSFGIRGTDIKIIDERGRHS